MRMLFLITDLQRGGTPTVVRELACRLRDEDFQTEAASLSGWGPISGELNDLGIPVYALGARSMLDFRPVSRKLAALLQTRHYDVVFSFLVHANVMAAWTFRLASDARPRLVQSIQTTQKYPRWHWRAQRWAARSAERIIVPSQSIANAAMQRSGIPRNKLHVIPNAIDPLRFASLRRDPGRPMRTVGFLGRLDRVKRIEDLVHAMRQVDSSIHLKIFGAGEDGETLPAKIRALNLENRVILCGMAPSPQEALRELDALVLPSEAEGMPMVLIEAMAAGVPVIGTDVDGIRDVIHPERTGLLVPVRQPESLAGAIHRLAGDAELRGRLVRNALEQVERDYTWARVLPMYREQLLPAPGQS